ncbi:MAG: RAMP superfamily CRISPR-associated protein [Candidatus Eremiobacterota bacterium]
MILEMTLLSDTLPGSGEGLSGIIDRDISYDNFGIPYIPSKRIKGILRESARDLSDANLLTAKIIEIFGDIGQEKGCSFKISNGYLKNYRQYRDFLKYTAGANDLAGIFNRESLMDYFTYNRSQTTINRYTGTAEENSLRVSRVLKKGLIFDFHIDYDEKYKEDLEKIIKVTRHFGIARSRGLGHIKLSLRENSVIEKLEDKSNIIPEEASKLSVDKSEFNDEGLYELPLEITNLSQILVTNKVGGDQISETYIPGGFILGALAYNYIQKKSINPASDITFRDIFLSGEVKFCNLYPSKNDNTFYPSPVSLVKQKDTGILYDLAYETDAEEVKNIQTQSTSGQFIFIQNNDIYAQTVSKEIEYHHRRPKDRSIGHAGKNQTITDDGEFFQFEVISSHQSFSGRITGKYNYLKELLDTVDEEMTLYLGKSKTAQYGKCKLKIQGIKELDKSEKLWQKDENIVITLVSDMILLDNKYGFNDSSVENFKIELARFLQIDPSEIEIKKSFLKYKKIGGFLGVWKLPKIQSNALAAGSVIILKNNSQKDIILEKLTGKSFGTRIEEGFGQIKINWHGDKQLTKVTKEPDNPRPDDITGLKDLLEYILLNQLKVSLKSEAIEKSNNFVEIHNLTSTFINKIILFIKNSSGFNELEEKFNQLKIPAKGKLEKIKSDLKISEKDKSYKLNISDFENLLGQKRDSSDIPVLRDNILTQINSQPDFYKDKIYELYQCYTLSFLTNLKYMKRGEK